ncbi:MAG: hypothetical protein U0Q16_04570 [Bryobacteraceae bacterium]
MHAAIALLLFAADPPLDRILERLSEEAEIFMRKAPRVVAKERLLHRGRKSPPRFVPRVGAKSIEAALGYVEREVVSEYGWAAMKEQPANLIEFRQVVSVDGKQVRKEEKARLALAMNMTSEDDRQRKRMLQDLEKHGMVGAATDFSQDILLFRRASLSNYGFRVMGPGKIGSTPTIVVEFLQKGGDETARVFAGRDMQRIKLGGEIQVRERDLLPMRISLRIPTKEDGLTVLHTGEIDYYQSRYGMLLPSAVRYKKLEGETILVENFAFYKEYKMFQVETDIKFTPDEAPPEQP